MKNFKEYIIEVSSRTEMTKFPADFNQKVLKLASGIETVKYSFMHPRLGHKITGMGVKRASDKVISILIQWEKSSEDVAPGLKKIKYINEPDDKGKMTKTDVSKGSDSWTVWMNAAMKHSYSKEVEIPTKKGDVRWIEAKSFREPKPLLQFLKGKIKRLGEEVEIVEGHESKIGDALDKAFQDVNIDWKWQNGTLVVTKGLEKKVKKAISDAGLEQPIKGIKSEADSIHEVAIRKSLIRGARRSTEVGATNRSGMDLSRVWDKLGNLEEKIIKVEWRSDTKSSKGKEELKVGKATAVKERWELPLTNVKKPKGVKYFFYMKNDDVSFAVGDMSAEVTSISGTNPMPESVEIEEKWKRGTYTMKHGETGKVLGKFKSGVAAQRAMNDLVKKGEHENIKVELDENI
jgi:hypothetical protein